MQRVTLAAVAGKRKNGNGNAMTKLKAVNGKVVTRVMWNREGVKSPGGGEYAKPERVEERESESHSEKGKQQQQ